MLKALGIDTGWEILAFVMALVFVLGFFFDWIEICLIVLPVFAPGAEGSTSGRTSARAARSSS